MAGIELEIKSVMSRAIAIANLRIFEILLLSPERMIIYAEC